MAMGDWPLSERGRERMRRTLEGPWAAGLAHVLSSDERKALDGAEILAKELGIPHDVVPELGENERSATDFLPPAEFWAVVERFFAEPERSVRSWESAAHAQRRVRESHGRVDRDRSRR